MEIINALCESLISTRVLLVQRNSEGSETRLVSYSYKFIAMTKGFLEHYESYYSVALYLSLSLSLCLCLSLSFLSALQTAIVL